MASITFHGDPVSTVGELPAVGSTAPAFELVGADLAPVTSQSLAGRRVVLNIFPSVDTGVCAASVRQFNKLASELDNTTVVCVSADLPFAGARFCGAEGLTNVVTGSTFRSTFGADYGVTLADGPLAGLLSRAVVVLDESGKVIYTEQVPEVGQEPDYDAAVAEWISEGECAGGVFTRRSTLRYGENPHQAAAVYTDGTGGLAQAEQLGGKEMSYNNYQDVDAALRAAYDHAGPAVAVVKHANPCGLAVGEDVADAYRRAHACDPVSAYGGVIAANREVSADMAEAVAGVFTEAIAAPGFAPEALDILSRKKNLRILRVGELDPTRDVRPISGGILLQDRDLIDAPGDDPASWTLVSGDPADGPALRDLEFAWRAVRAVKSNAILLARDGASVGIGMGQVNRVDSCRLAVTRAGDRAAGAVAASDAYFPFADGFEVLARAGVRAVVQPGGSIRDEEVISSARASSVTMYLTGTRHFAH